MMQAIKNLIAAFNSEDEEEDDEVRGAVERGRQYRDDDEEAFSGVAVTTYTGSEEEDGEETSGASGSTWSDSESGRSGDEAADSLLMGSGVPPLLKGEYYGRLGRDYWTLNSDAVMQVYKRFLDYAPIAQCQHQRPYTELDLIGLEYLLSDTGRKHYDSLPFPAYSLNAFETGQVHRLGAQCVDTFIVSRTMDYVYGRLIELALMQGVNARRLPHGMEGIRSAYWLRRNQLFPLCRKPQCLTKQTGDDDTRQCHQQCVIYTRTDSDFYVTCERLRDCNRYVDYEKHSGVTVRQRISFHLVNLLCGPFVSEQPNTVEKYDKWVVLPIDALDLWNASRRTELNTSSTY